MVAKRMSEAVMGSIRMDTSYTGKVIVSDGGEQIHVPFGKKIMFITVTSIYEGVLERVSDDGFNLVLDGKETPADSPICFFATLD